MKSWILLCRLSLQYQIHVLCGFVSGVGRAPTFRQVREHQDLTMRRAHVDTGWLRETVAPEGVGIHMHGQPSSSQAKTVDVSENRGESHVAVGRPDVPDSVVGPGLSEGSEANRGQPEVPMHLAALQVMRQAVMPVWKLGQAGRYEPRSQDSRCSRGRFLLLLRLPSYHLPVLSVRRLRE